MMEIFREASDITSYDIRACIDQVREKSGDSPKLIIAEKLIKNMNREVLIISRTVLHHKWYGESQYL